MYDGVLECGPLRTLFCFLNKEEHLVLERKCFHFVVLNCPECHQYQPGCSGCSKRLGQIPLFLGTV